jgi:hypothetical protein
MFYHTISLFLKNMYYAYFKPKFLVYNEIIKKYECSFDDYFTIVKCRDGYIVIRYHDLSLVYNSLAEFEMIYEKYYKLLEYLSMFDKVKPHSFMTLVYIEDMYIELEWCARLGTTYFCLSNRDKYYVNITIQEIIDHISNNYPYLIKNNDIKIALKD